jgi:hypothetical protein
MNGIQIGELSKLGWLNGLVKHAIWADSLYFLLLLEKSKLGQHAYEEGHRVGWDAARILEIESNNGNRKYKELAHMACLTNAISQPSLDSSPIWIPFISNEVSNSQR